MLTCAPLWLFRYSSHYVSPLDSVVILDGAPVVGPDRADKLIGAVVKSAAKEAGVTITKASIEMPTDEANQSKGFMFVTLGSVPEAQAFQRAMHDLKFDKRHTFRVVPFSKVPDYDQVQDTFAEPEAEEWAPREHFRAWLADPAGRDQIALYANDDVQIAWTPKNGPAESAFEKNKWTDSYLAWSPRGTLLTTMHGPGFALWGGSSFQRLNRFMHPEVKLIDFSPFERYVVSWSPRPIEAGTSALSPFTEEDEGHQIAVWDTMTGQLLRTFPMVNDQSPAGVQKQISWPMFKWSPDEKYLARVTPDVQISVYEVPSMTLVGKKSLKVEGVLDFEWAPLSDLEREQLEAERDGRELSTADGKKKAPTPIRENMIAFWTPEVQNQPARVTLMNFPSRLVVRSKNLFNVSDCKIHWQSNGDYLCVKVDRHTKTKKTQYCNLELFRAREKDCPVQVIEIKDAVSAFAWEPKGERFVLITTADPVVMPGQLAKTSVSFYGYDQRKGDYLCLKTVENKNSNRIYWSPKGRHVVVATLGSNSKFEIEFYDLDLERDAEKTDAQDLGAAIKCLATVEHYGLTDLEWDPSGRYVATSASIWMSTMEAGWALWDFKGVELQKHTVEKFKQLLWRPRPPTLLSREQQKKIRKNLREYARAFEQQDELEELNESAELIAHRRRLIEEWNAWRRGCRERVAAAKKDLGKEDVAPKREDVEEEVVEEWVEEIISEVVEELP